MAEIIVPKKDELAVLREMVERVEGELASLERSVKPEDKAVLSDESVVIEKLRALNERVKNLDKVGATPGERTFVAGGNAANHSASNLLGKAITAARRVARGQRLGDDYSMFVRVQSEGTDTAGGVTVPVDTAAEVIRFIGELSLARKLGRVVNMATDQMIIPIDNGAQTAYWPSEGGTMTDSSAAFKAAANSKLDSATCAVINKISKELSEDSLVMMENYLGEYAAETIAAEENKQMLVGSGSPFSGIVGATGVTDTQFGSTKTAFSNITFADLAAAEFSVDQSVFGNLTWVMHKDAFLEVFKLRDSNGYPLFSTSWQSGLPGATAPNQSQNNPSLLLGSPVYLSKQMPTSAANKCFAIVGSFRDGFVFGDRRALTVEWDDSIFFKERQRAILISERVAMLVAKGSAFATITTAAS